MSNLDKLPRMCMSRLNTTGDPIWLKRGEKGYWLAEGYDPDTWNKNHSVTPAQVAAMENGSMFGFDVPAADPENDWNAKLTDYPYNEPGRPKAGERVGRR